MSNAGIGVWICEHHPKRATVPSGTNAQAKCWLCGRWSSTARILADATDKEIRRIIRQAQRGARGTK